MNIELDIPDWGSKYEKELVFAFYQAQKRFSPKDKAILALFEFENMELELKYIELLNKIMGDTLDLFKQNVIPKIKNQFPEHYYCDDRAGEVAYYHYDQVLGPDFQIKKSDSCR